METKKAPKKGTLSSTELLRRGWDSNPRTPYDVTSLAGKLFHEERFPILRNTILFSRQ